MQWAHGACFHCRSYRFSALHNPNQEKYCHLFYLGLNRTHARILPHCFVIVPLPKSPKASFLSGSDNYWTVQKHRHPVSADHAQDAQGNLRQIEQNQREKLQVSHQHLVGEFWYGRGVLCLQLAVIHSWGKMGDTCNYWSLAKTFYHNFVIFWVERILGN